MARVFDRAVANEARDDDDGVGGGRSAIRLLAAAITALVVSFLVVARSQGAVSGGSARSGSELSAGGVTVTDDDTGHSLFQVPAMAPGTRWSHRFLLPGTFTYHCAHHTDLVGQIDEGVTIDDGSGTSPSTPAACPWTYGEICWLPLRSWTCAITAAWLLPAMSIFLACCAVSRSRKNCLPS